MERGIEKVRPNLCDGCERSSVVSKRWNSESRRPARHLAPVAVVEVMGTIC